MVVPTGVEPVTSWMSTKRSTTELRNRYGESYGNRTRINGITIRGVDRYTNNSIICCTVNLQTLKVKYGEHRGAIYC